MVPTFSEGSFFADRYRVEALLGTGAMGRVYAATELHGEGRKVALKVLHKERMAEEETVERFRREANVLASIGHPCIVKIYTFHHTADGVPYLAMEMLEGLTLKTRLQNAGRFETPLELQEIVDGISGALSAAHARGIVHRDLKPDNIFLLATGEPRAKLVDFGLSRLAKADKSLTHSGMILGTPRYMAPEQIKDAASAGPAGDIYSFGVIIFECLTGQSPYPAEDYGQLLGCVLEARTRPLESLRPDLPKAVGDVIRRALQANPEDRYRTCDELADAYGAAIGSPSKRTAIAATANAAAAAAAAQPRKQRQRKISQGGLVASKSSTLAFDASAAREMLEKMVENAPDNAPKTIASADAGRFAFPSAENTEPEASPYAGPTPDYDRGHPSSHPPAKTTPLGEPMPPSFASSPPPAQSSPPPAQNLPPAQGGDTMFLPSSGVSPVVPPYDPSSPQVSAAGYGGPNTSSPQQYNSPSQFPPAYPPSSGPAHPVVQPYQQPQFGQPPQPQPSAPPKKKGRGLLIVFFLGLMLVVIAFSAVAGFALKEYQRTGNIRFWEDAAAEPEDEDDSGAEEPSAEEPSAEEPSAEE